MRRSRDWRQTIAAVSLTCVLLVGLVVGLMRPARSDIQLIQATVTFTASGYSPVLALTGQPSCSVVTTSITGSPSYTIVPQVSSDYPVNQPGTWVTASGVGSGSITSDGTNVGTVSSSGLTGFRLYASSVSGGSVQAVYSCSGATNPASAGTVLISPIPLPVTVTSQPPIVTTVATSPIPTASAGLTPPPSAAPNISILTCVFPLGGQPAPTAGNLVTVPCDASGNLQVDPIPKATLQVNTPAPCSTASCATVVYPGITPWPVNTPAPIQSIIVTSIASSIPAPTSTWPVTTPAPCITPTCYSVVYPGVTPWPVTTPAPIQSIIITSIASALPVPTVTWPVTTPAPIQSIIVTSIASSIPAPTSTWPVSSPLPVASAFATMVATTGPLVVTSGAATVYSGFFTNGGGATAYCSLYNVAAASVTPGTTQPLIQLAVAGGQTMPFFTPPTQGLSFGTAVSEFCATALGGGTSATGSTIWLSVFYR